MSALSFVFPDKVPIKAAEGAVWHNKRSQYQLGYLESHMIQLLRNVMHLKGNKLAAAFRPT